MLLNKLNPFLKFASEVSLRQMLQEQREAILVRESDPHEKAYTLTTLF